MKSERFIGLPSGEEKIRDRKERTQRWITLDPSIAQRATDLTSAYRKFFGENEDSFREESLVLSCAPGRAEILGNHTDYNQGYTLSANIKQNLLMVGEPRQDNIFQVVSLDQDNNIIRFTGGSVEELLQQKTNPKADDAWSNYIKGVIWSFKEKGLLVSGFNAVIQSTIPLGAGVSSSAAIELATAELLATINNVNISSEVLASLCKDAENTYVGVPCGYLDQGTIALADSGWLEMSYRPSGGHPFTWERIAMDLSKHGYSLVVGYDPESKHELVDGKYKMRQDICKESVPILQSLLPNIDIQALRDVTGEEFDTVREQFTAQAGETAANFVTHVIHEDERVSQAANALKQGDIERFGVLMTSSGKSAIELYNLAEGAPELRFLYEAVVAHQNEWGVAGIRNMGGGFNATTLALVRTDSMEEYKKALKERYANTYARDYHFLDFVPAPSAGILDTANMEVEAQTAKVFHRR